MCQARSAQSELRDSTIIRHNRLYKTNIVSGEKLEETFCRQRRHFITTKKVKASR